MKSWNINIYIYINDQDKGEIQYNKIRSLYKQFVDDILVW